MMRASTEGGRTVSAASTPAGGLVKSADRTLRVLEHLAVADSRKSLHALHLELGIPKSSLHGLLRTLQARGWVETDESGTLFGLGVRALLVGTSYIDSDDIVALTRDVLDRLSAETGETVHLGRLDGGEVVYLSTRQSVHYLRTFSRVGRRLPAHATALGKSVLAMRPDAELQELLHPPLESLTPHTITDLDALREELAHTRERGHAVDHEENTLGLGCFAMALPTASPPQDAISISVPLVRLGEGRSEELVASLQQAVAELSERGRTIGLPRR